MAGTSAAAASENDAVTMGNMPAGRSAATDAASMATASKANLVRITRCYGMARRRVLAYTMSRTNALLIVSSKPSAVDKAAAKPPAATRPDTT